MNSYVSSRERKGGSNRNAGLSIRWGARWQPPKGTTTKAVLIPGMYEAFDGKTYAYYPYVEIYSARTQRSFVSSAEYTYDEHGVLTKRGGNCLGWDEYIKEAERERDSSKRSVSLRLRHAFTVLHLANYHKVPVLDNEGNERKYARGKRAGETIYNDEPCIGHKCKLCRAGEKPTFGSRRHWSVGLGHLSNIGSITSSIEQDCAHCGASGSIVIPKWTCEKCGKTLIHADKYDPTNEKEQGELKTRTLSVNKCRHCEHEGMPVPVLHCEECDKPEPLSIFDCALDIKREGEKAKSAIYVPRWKKYEIPESLAEIAKPWDFSTIFFPDNFDVQMRALNLKECPYTEDSKSGKKDEEESKEDVAEYADYDD